MIFHIEEFDIELTINGRQAIYMLDGTVDVEFSTEHDEHYIKSVDIISMFAIDDSDNGYFESDVTDFPGLVEKIIEKQEDDFLEEYEKENPVGCSCGHYCSRCV